MKYKKLLELLQKMPEKDLNTDVKIGLFYKKGGRTYMKARNLCIDLELSKGRDDSMVYIAVDVTRENIRCE